MSHQRPAMSNRKLGALIVGQKATSLGQDGSNLISPKTLRRKWEGGLAWTALPRILLRKYCKVLARVPQKASVLRRLFAAVAQTQAEKGFRRKPFEVLKSISGIMRGFRQNHKNLPQLSETCCQNSNSPFGTLVCGVFVLSQRHEDLQAKTLGPSIYMSYPVPMKGHCIHLGQIYIYIYIIMVHICWNLEQMSSLPLYCGRTKSCTGRCGLPRDLQGFIHLKFWGLCLMLHLRIPPMKSAKRVRQLVESTVGASTM